MTTPTAFERNLSLDVLDPDLLLAAYREGLFPMSIGREQADVEFYDPDPRAIIRWAEFHCSKSLRRVISSGVFDIHIDRAFERVVHACAKPRPNEGETWINDAIIDAFVSLHERGHAHSVEAWRDGCLVGGLYGLHIGGAFFGESMFHRPESGGTNASKVCLAHLVRRLDDRGFVVFDVQILSPHLRSLGANEIPRSEFRRILAGAVQMNIVW